MTKPVVLGTLLLAVLPLNAARLIAQHVLELQDKLPRHGPFASLPSSRLGPRLATLPTGTGNCPAVRLP